MGMLYFSTFVIPFVWNSVWDLDIMLLRVFEFREYRHRRRRPLFVGLNEINIYSPALKPYDIQKVKDAWVNSVYCVTAYMICSFVACACSNDLYL
jgi:hypothetical protein